MDDDLHEIKVFFVAIVLSVLLLFIGFFIGKSIEHDVQLYTNENNNVICYELDISEMQCYKIDELNLILTGCGE